MSNQHRNIAAVQSGPTSGEPSSAEITYANFVGVTMYVEAAKAIVDLLRDNEIEQVPGGILTGLHIILDEALSDAELVDQQLDNGRAE